MARVVMCGAIVCVCVAPLSVTASAQERASIVGLVQDSSGAVLPGVTVEAASPVLIERVRTGVTDGNGRYAIIDLRPGTYTVTFSLPGFSRVRRDGIVLEGAFAAQVNAALAVGTVEETVTVSGQSPVVDLQSTRTQFVANQAILETLPVGRTLNTAMGLVPGVNSYTTSSGASASQILSELYINTATVHGSLTGDQHRYVDGMNVSQMLLSAGSQISANPANDLGFTEIAFDVSSHSAESAHAGVRADVIPKEGGNAFSGVYRAFGSNQKLQAENLTPALKVFIKDPSKIDFNWESNAALGGPIRQNKLWYFAALKFSQYNMLMRDTYFPDGRQADSGGHVSPNATLRLTYQMTRRNKLRLSANHGTMLRERGDVSGLTSPEASLWLSTPLNYSITARGTSVVTNRLLLEVGQSLHTTTYNYDHQPEVGRFDVQKREATTGWQTGAYANPTRYRSYIYNTIANASYVTGSHAFKTGMSLETGNQKQLYQNNGDMSVLTFINGVASSVSVRNTPVTKYEDVNANLGLFAQDTWALKQLTFNLGARFDYLNASVPAQSAPGGRFVPAHQADAIPCLPCWKDWAVRLGVSYDLFGTGKTALKATVGKFVESMSAGIAQASNPLQRQTDSRNWRDLDGNGTALDEFGNVQWDEIGPSRNANFGVPRGATRFDPDTPRGSNWEETVSIVHELMPNVSVTAGYYRRHFYNLRLTKNLLVDPVRDWTPYTIMAPQHPLLPNGGGDVITQYNLNADRLGAVDSVSTFSTQNTRLYNGFELSLNARLPRGGFAFGGVTTDRTATSECDVSDSDPNNLRFCNQVPPFRVLYKASAGYPLPYDLHLSGTFQLRPASSIGSDYTFGSAIAGIPLTGGGNRTVQLVDPTILYYDYAKQFDLRVARTFRFGRRRALAFVEIFNLPNMSTVSVVNTTVGPRWRDPLITEQPRRFQLGAQLDF